MKNIYKHLLTLMLLAVTSFSAQAQCPNDNAEYISQTAPSVIGASVGDECIFPGEYITVEGMIAGNTYRLSTCNTTDVADTRITVYSGNGANALTYNDDFCGLLSRVDFTPTANGNYRILVDQTGPGNTCDDGSDCVELTITLIGVSGSTDYCIPTYTTGTANGDFINGVSLGLIDNQGTGATDGPSYNDFTNLSATLSSNASYTLSVSNNPDFSEIVSAWIDYNQDFQFSEDERLGQINLSANQTGDINFTTPANVLPGATRLRVRMVFSVPTTGGLVDPCASSSIGETEDYTATFTTGNPPVGPGSLSFSTTCGVGLQIQDNACPNNTLSTVEVGGLGSLGTTHNLVSAEVIIEHAMAADLDLFLEGPDGTVVELSTDNGESGANYGIYTIGDCSQTALFSMSATTPIAGSTAPFVGSYLPEGDLNDFNAGTNPNGLWRLRACDDFSGDVGTIQFVRLNFELNATEPPACAENLNVVDGAGNIALDQQLSWSAGAGNPTAYDVFFGTDENNLSLVSDDQTETTFDPGALNPATDYFYQIVPSNNAGDAVGCPVISFTTVADDVTTILMSNGQSTTCEANFFDSGGPNGNTSPGGAEPFVYTIFPDAPNSAVQVNFSSFELGAFDLFGIANGEDGNAEVVYFYPINNTEAPTTITATNPSGALTFVFQADPFVTQPGWAASITCVPFGSVPACVESSTPANNSLAVALNAQLNWVAGSGEPTGYDVYFGTDMNPPLVASGVAATTYNPGVLVNETTYYYQIVPTNASGAAVDCPVNSFITEADAANVVLISDGAASLCEGFFYDSGNSTGDYNTDENFELTISPDSPNSAIEVEFSSFNVEEEFDVLTVYSGTGTAGVVLGTLTGEVAGPFSFTSVSPDGALTFVFVSDEQVTSSGWVATIACVEPLTVPSCVSAVSPADAATDIPVSGSVAEWSASADATGYDLFFGTDAGDLALVSEGQTELTFNLPDLEFNTEYFWQVVPSNLVGSAEDCPVFSFTTEQEPITVWDIIVNSDIHTTLEDLVILAELDGALQGPGPLTVFAPTDAAFALLPTEVVDALVADPTGALAQVLLYHVVAGQTLSGDLTDGQEIVTLNTGTVTVTITVDGIFINDAQVILADQLADNGVVHVIDAVLVPAEEQTTVWDIIVNSDVHTTLEDLVILAELDGALQGPGPLTVFAPTDAAFALLPTEVVDALVADPTGALAQVLLYHVVAGQTLSGDLTDGQEIVTLNTGTVTVTITVDGIFINDAQVILADQLADNGVVHVIDAVLIPEAPVTEILMQEGAITACEGIFTDDGGSEGNYATNTANTLTITPDQPGNVLQVTFSEFNVEGDGFDFLEIFNGTSTDPADLIGLFDDITIPSVVTSTAADGALTFVFTSDGSVTLSGWVADVACIDPNAAPECATNFSPADASTEVVVTPTLSWNPGAGVTDSYNVFFGTDAGNLVLVSEEQVETTFTPDALDLNTTYFWQVVPVSANGSAEDCIVNSFTTESVQTVLMQNETFTLCAANFFDAGGADGNYTINNSDTLTFIPDAVDNLIQVFFNDFLTEEGFDELSIFDGNSIDAPLIGTFSGDINDVGNELLVSGIISSAEDGSLTFLFESDGSVVGPGWDATIQCVNPNEPAACAENFLPADASTDVSLGNLTLSWSPGATVVTGYNVFFGTDSENLVLVSENQPGTTFTPEGIELSTTYFWQIIPINENGDAVDCIVNSFTTSSVLDILMTTGTVTTCDANFFDIGGADANYNLETGDTLTILPDSPNSAVQVTFNLFDVEDNWDALYVFDGPDADSPIIPSGNGGTTSGFPEDGYWGTDLIGPFTSTHPSGALTFVFLSDDTQTEIGWDASVTCISTTTPPECVTNVLPADLTVDASVSTQISWTAPSGVVLGYNVFFGTDPDNLELVSEGQTGTSFSPGQLEVGTQYFWQVVAFNDGGEAVDCSVQSFTTADEITLNIFDGEITLCAGSLFDTGGPDGNYAINEDVTLTVFPETPGSFIQIDFVSFALENNFDFLDVYNGNNTNNLLFSLTGAGLPAQIISSAPDGSLTLNFNSDGSVVAAGFELTFSCFVPVEPPLCSTNLLPIDASEAPLNAVLSWTGNGFPTSYNVLFGTDPDNLVEVASALNATSFDPGPLDPNTTYFWQIIAVNDLGTSEDCPIQSFTTAGTAVVNMFDGEVTTCNAEFYDSGSADGAYSVNESSVLTIFPEIDGNFIRVTFNNFNVEPTWDALYVYNGSDVTAPIIGSGNPATQSGFPADGWYGTDIVIGPFTSTDASGALTFEFLSDGSVTRPGWDALIECISADEVPGCVTNPVPSDLAVDVNAVGVNLSWGLGSGVALAYDVFFGTDPDNLILVSDDQAGTSFGIGDLALGTEYFWQVVPSNDAGFAEGCPVFSFTTAEAIEIVMSNTTVTTCNATFFDSGNIGANYSNSENFTLTIFPDIPGNSIQVSFNSFNVEPTWDALYIFNGPDANAPIFPSGNPATQSGFPADGWYGTDIDLGSFTSSDPSGALTFVFRSDGSVPRPGWDATVSCIDATQPPSCVTVLQGPTDGEVDVCINEALLSWESGPGAPATTYDVFFDFGGGLVLVSDDQTATTFEPGILVANTTFAYQIVPSNANGEAVDCPVVTFTTGTCLNYCDPATTTATCFEFISNVQMGDINNESGCIAGGYNDFTEQSTNVFIGSPSPITITNGDPQFAADVLNIWVDWNQDGSFDVATEFVVVNGSPGVGPYTANITPPVDAVLGEVRMRIFLQDASFNPIIDPCGIVTFGEIEDYTLIVNEALACAFPNDILTSETTTTSTVVTWTEVTDALEYQIRYRLDSEDVTVDTWTNPIIVPAPLTFHFLENLTICENYILQIGSVCEEGATDIVFSSNIFFGTRCIDCLPEYTLEGEDCGSDVNGGCNSTPAAFGSISCGETICGTSFHDGATRDTDWYNFEVTEEGVFQLELIAEFDGILFLADATDCADITIPTQSNFSAGQPFVLASQLEPGTYTVIILPIFEQPNVECGGFNGYTVSLSSGDTQIAPANDVCETTPAFNLFAIPAGGTWSGDGITDATAGTFDPASVGVGSYVVTYTPEGAGCSVPDSITIEVGEAPEADFVGLDATYCPGAEDVVLTGIPGGGIFSIEPSVEGAIAGNIFVPSVCAPGTYEITYVVSDGSSSCAGSITQTVEILAAPVATIDALADSVCSQDDAITLVGTPAGGTFSGPGVEGDSFNPSLAGLGMVMITYTVSEEGFECPAVATDTIQVNPAPVVSIGGVSGDYCLNSSDVTLEGIPALGTFFIDGVESADGIFSPAAAGLGEHVIRYEFDNGTCIGFSELTINIVENITISFVGTPTAVCSEDDPFLVVTDPAGAVLSGLGVFGNTFSPKVAGAGTHVISATYTEGNCSATAEHTIVVNASPIAAFTYNVNGSTVSFNNSSLNATDYTWDFGDGETSTSVNPTHTYEANGEYTITLTASNEECGNSVFTADLELSVGIGSIEGVDMIQLFPNPTSGMLNLAFNSLNQQSFEVRITDATGRLIEVDAMTNFIGKFNKQYDLSSRAKGIYIFTVTSDKGAINFRVVKD